MLKRDRAPCVTAEARAILARTNLFGNAYLRVLQDGSLGLDEFRRTQEQFYFAVEYYPRPMAALLSRIPDPAARIDILRNLVEERGDFVERAFHRNTFRRFLETIGARPAPLEDVPVWPEVRAFNCVLSAACALEEPGVGIGCLGIIELAFANISAQIGAGVVGRGWVRREDLVHYSLHAELDIRHADDFFAAAEPLWHDPARRRHVRDGLELGAHAFGRLYADLHARTLIPPAPTGDLRS